jgi:hemerythrin-like domain-containing protein
MLPVGPLMIEHRLIERMIALMSAAAEKIDRDGAADMDFIRTVVDFIRVYADQLHHGKEESILFRDLAKKTLSGEHRRIMEELISEHVIGRGMMRNLAAARTEYLLGEKSALAKIAAGLKALAAFYPPHIAKEDKRFFLPIMNYLSPAEHEAILREFSEFDRKFIHQHYQDVVSELDGRKNFTVR